ncbi:MAG: EamA family transporter [Tepidamorphaceae bacterium]
MTTTHSQSPHRSTATLIGFTAVLMWALLALFTAASGKVPPFQLSAMCFAIGGCIGLTRWITVPQARAALARQPWKAWVLGIGGLFGYHFFYFTALRNAPAVEAGLIAYLWPLLIVLSSAMLPGEHLRWHHIAGALFGFAGAALIVTRGESLEIDPQYSLGYLAACVCALTWTGYSVLSRRFSAVPTDVVTGFCLATAALSVLCHLALEETVWPANPTEWLAVIGLGLLPVGLAFYTWDHGVKHGDIQLLGVAAYAAPLLSTLLLIAFGFAPLTWAVVAAAVLVTAGAGLAAKDNFRKKKI